MSVVSWITHWLRWNRWNFTVRLIQGARPRCAVPRLFVRGELWIALLGPSVEEGIVGIGSTVTAALRTFDTQYLAGLRPPAEAIGDYRRAQSVYSARENSVKLSVSLSRP